MWVTAGQQHTSSSRRAGRSRQGGVVCILLLSVALSTLSTGANAALTPEDLLKPRDGWPFVMVASNANCLRHKKCKRDLKRQMDARGCDNYVMYQNLGIVKADCKGKKARTASLPLTAFDVQSQLAQIPQLSAADFDGLIKLIFPWLNQTATTESLSLHPYAFGGGSVNLWALDRVNQVRGVDGNIAQCANGGKGVDVYLLDTGCRTTHTQFDSRAVSTGADGNGHGTHTAAIVGGKDVGVAPRANLHCVKVMADDGSGSYSDLIEAMDQVRGIKLKDKNQKIVASMSLGGAYSVALDAAVERLAETGVVVVVAAGNDAKDASGMSPASSASAITVGAVSDVGDLRDPWYSNYGRVLDMYCPGTNILSAYITCDTCYRYLTGTSMATPMVAGMAACILGNSAPGQFCENPQGYIDRMKNPSVEIYQPVWGDNYTPMCYMPAGSTQGC